MPFFSTIIPSFNRATFIGATIESVLAQQYTDNEIIVADDGSTDDTMQVLDRYRGRIHVYRQDNAGPGAARNLGLRHARGKYVAFLDSDDLWFPWTLTTYKELIDLHGQPAIVTTVPRKFVDHTELDGVKQEPTASTHYASFFRSSVAWGLPSATTMRLDRIVEAGGFTEKYCEDVDIWLRMGMADGLVVAQQPICCGYREHASGISTGWRYRVYGNHHLVDQEIRGAYPGGDECRRRRIEFITLHVRPTSLMCLQAALPREAFRLYSRSFQWHVELGRFMYLSFFPLMWATSVFRHVLPASSRKSMSPTRIVQAKENTAS